MPCNAFASSVKTTTAAQSDGEVCSNNLEFLGLRSIYNQCERPYASSVMLMNYRLVFLYTVLEG